MEEWKLEKRKRKRRMRKKRKKRKERKKGKKGSTLIRIVVMKIYWKKTRTAGNASAI